MRVLMDSSAASQRLPPERVEWRALVSSMQCPGEEIPECRRGMGLVMAVSPEPMLAQHSLIILPAPIEAGRRHPHVS